MFNIGTKTFIIKLVIDDVIVLKVIDGWLTLTLFLENITSYACLERSGLKFIFRSLSRWLAEILGSYMVENNVSSANSFTVDFKFPERSFMYIRKMNGPKIETCGSPASTDDQLEHWPLSTTCCSLSPKKLLSRLRRFPEILICSSLNSNPSCHTMPKAFKISKKLALILRAGCWSKLA